MTKPSWQDFGTFDESAYPELWDGVVGAWCPSLGPTGSRQHDLSRSMNWQNATSLPTYDVRGGVTAVVGNPGLSATTPAHYLSLTEATMFAWVNKSVQGDVVACGPLTGPNNSRFGFVWFSDGNLYASIEQSSTNFASQSLTGAGSRLIGLQYRGITGNTVSGVWVDGVRTAGPTAPSSLRTTASTSSLTTDGQSVTSANGATFGMMFWRRCLTDSEMRQISRIGLPALFERRRRTLRRVAVEQATFRSSFSQRSALIGSGVY
jgi:hypothetical protein